MEVLLRIAVIALAAVAVSQAVVMLLLVTRAIAAVKEAIAFGERANLLARSPDVQEFATAEERLSLGRRHVSDGPKEPKRLRVDPLWNRPPRSVPQPATPAKE